MPYLKGGEFIIHQSQAADVYIPEQATEEQQMIRQAAKDFIKNEIDPALDRLDAREPGLTEKKLEIAGQLGLLGLTVPEQYGGSGVPFITSAYISEVFGGAHGFSVSFGAQTGIGTLPILYYGTEEQRQKYLPKLATGELKASYCLTEPGSGSDALGAKTRADLSPDGTHYILNGQKIFITNAGFADIFIVFAQVDGLKFSAFIVEKKFEGVSLGEEEKKMGIKASSTRQVFFQNVKVPKENLLGEIGKGHKIAFQILNVGRFKLGIGTLGGCKRAIDTTVKYANERQQFKTPISNFGAIKHKLGEIAIRTWTAEAAAFRTAGLIEERENELRASGASMTEVLTGGAEEYAIECALLKVLGSEVLDFVIDECLQTYGGYGFIEEYPMARAYRDARINRIYEGTNEINRLLSVDMLLKRAVKGSLDLMKPAMAIQKELMSVPEMSSPDSEDIFSAEKKALLNAKKTFILVAGGAFQKLTVHLAKEQEIIMNAADVLIDIYTMESAMHRAEKLVAMNGREASQIYIDMVRCFFFDAMDRIYVNGRRALSAFAEGDELRIMMMGLKRFTKYDLVNGKQIRRDIADKMIAENGYCFWD
ncbi:MAG: acyl-CoA dehydrogenase family protein [Bacteroidetes bacterium]|nr:acyl-CoA dehydrogenase family protein [Bacteroidota bacterium]